MTQTSQRLEMQLAHRYRFERELGRGGMATVYLAQDLKHNRLVAIKVLHPELAAAVTHARFLREIEILARLNHPNILPLHDSGATSGFVYYVMPFVQGESLRARLQQGGMPIADAVEILQTIADAVAYAHQQGIVHRDLKPENILFQSGHPLIADFGIARAAQLSRTGVISGEDTLTHGVSVGTPAYMAPEQAAADPGLDHRADVYTLGVIAYEMITGERPFVRSNTQQVIAAHVLEIPRAISELRPDVPERLAALVTRCLKKDPRDRPQSAEQIATELRQISAQQVGRSVAEEALLQQRHELTRVLWIYVGAFLLVGVVAWIVLRTTGLPDWVFPGAALVMALGLPVIVLTATVNRAGVQHTLGSSSPRSRFHAALLRLRPYATWRHTAIGGVGAMLAFSFIVGGFMALRAFGVGSPGTLFGAGALQPNEQLLLADFAIHGTDSTFSPTLTAATRAALEQSTAFSIVSPVLVSSALARMQLPRSHAVDPETAREIAAREGIKGIIQGELTSLGGELIVALRLIAAESGTTLAPFSTTVRDEAELIPAIDKLSRQIRSKIGESLKQIRETPPLERVSTRSLEALRKYSAGVRAHDVDQNPSKAVGLLREAVALDTGFAMAWRKLAVALGNSGIARVGTPMFDSAVTRAFRHRERATEPEREEIEAYYYWTGPGHDRQLAANAYESIVERDSAPSQLGNLGQIYWSRREFARAERINRALIGKQPDNAVGFTNLIEALYEQGKLAEAERTIAIAKRRFPGQGPAHLASALHYFRGDLDSYARSLDSVQADSRAGTRVSAALDRASLALLRGQLTDYERRRAAAGETDDPILFARIDAELRGDHARAIRRLNAAVESAQRRPAKERPYIYLAVTFARVGSPERARAMLERHIAEQSDTSFRRWVRPRVDNALGEIAMAEHRYAEAIAYFRSGDARPDGPVTACSICLPLSLAEAFDRAGQADSAIMMFERYLNTPFSARADEVDLDPLNVARVHERLGQLYEAKGDRAATAHYTMFIKLWQQADPVLQPRVTVARQHLSRLNLK